MAEKKFSQYNNSGALSLKIKEVPGLAGTIAYIVPLAGTQASPATATRTSTTDKIGFGVAVKIKRIVYTVRTAASVAADSLGIIMCGASQTSTLTLTDEAAGVAATSSELDGTLTALGSIYFILNARNTASDDRPAQGYLSVLYQEQFTNDGC